MPVTTQIDHDKALTIHTATGELSFEESLEAFKLFNDLSFYG